MLLFRSLIAITPFPQSWHPRAGPARRLVASFVSVSLCFIIHDYLAICLYSL